MDDLLPRLEKATGPDRRLDVSIECFLHPHWDTPERRGMMLRGRGAVYAPLYTASIDAALTLVPEGWYWAIRQLGPKSLHGGHVTVWDHGELSQAKRLLNAEAATPAIAICIAALRARIAEKG